MYGEVDVRSAEHLDGVVVRRGQLGHGQRSVVVPHREEAKTPRGASQPIADNAGSLNAAVLREEGVQVSIDRAVGQIGNEELIAWWKAKRMN